MKRLAMYIGVMLIGASIALSGCGAEKAAAPKAPLVKSILSCKCGIGIGIVQILCFLGIFVGGLSL